MLRSVSNTCMHELSAKIEFIDKVKSKFIHSKAVLFKVVRAQYELSFVQTTLLSISYMYVKQFVDFSQKFVGRLEDCATMAYTA